MKPLKIMTFNTQHCSNFLTGRIDYTVMANAVKKYSPDIVGLQEMRGKGESDGYDAQVEILSELCGMPYFFFAKAIDVGKDNPYGNGILSKIPIAAAEAVPIPDPSPRKYDGYYESRCLLKARLEGDLTVIVTHFGLNPDEQENAVNTVLSNIEPERCVLMGDFNADSDNPVLAPIRERLTDTEIALTGEKFTFPSDTPTKKIDYIFVSPDLEVLSAEIPECTASDHRPYLASVCL